MGSVLNLDQVGSPTDPRDQPSHVQHHNALVNAVGTNVDDIWNEPAPLSPWVNYTGGGDWWDRDTFRYRILPGGLVVLNGMVQYTGANNPPLDPQEQKIFELPVGYQPSRSLHFWCPTGNWGTDPNGTIVNVYGTDQGATPSAYSAGSIVAQFASGNSNDTWISLAPIMFVAD